MRDSVRVAVVMAVMLACCVAWTTAAPDEPNAAPIRLAQKSAAKKDAKGKKTATAKSAEPAAKVEAPADESGLAFSRDIAPILVGNCIGCHNPKDKARRKNLDLTTFKALMAGSASGKVIVAGKPEESPLVLHIKGEEEPKMPPNNMTLAAAAIEKIERWVKAGAKLDPGIETTAPLSKIAATPEDLRRAELAKLSPEERDQRAEAAAKERWKQADPKTEPTMASAKAYPHFLLFGNLPKERIAPTLKALEGQYAFLDGLLKRPGSPGINLAEKVSLYVFNDRAAYVEFARTVEKRNDVEEGEAAHGDLNAENPYIAVADPLGGREDESLKRRGSRSKKGDEIGPERTVAGLIAEQLAIAAAEQAGKPPKWLSLGLGAYLASKLEPRSPYYRRLHEVAAQQYQLGWQTKAQEALGGETDETKIRALGLTLLEWLSNDRQQLTVFSRTMLQGQDRLDDATRAAWGPMATREQLLENWGNYVASRYGRGR